MDNYDIISFIGEGSFGRVFKATNKETKAIVALKVIRKKGRSSKDLKSLRQECDIQRELKHPNIIRMIDSFDTETELVVVTEYAEQELHSILAKEGCLDEEKTKKITWHLVSALYYLHSHRVLHRDLKPQNVLLDNTGRAKLCDFGLARIMTNATHILTSIKGTPLYMAPELIDEKPYDHQADLWSLGCIVYELMAGQPPFCTMSIWQLVRMIRYKSVQWPSFISTEARSFLQGLLHKDPVKRMSWPEILEHSFVKGNILILPEDVPSDSPFTQPLTFSQQQAKQLQKDKIASHVRTYCEDSKVKDRRGHEQSCNRVAQHGTDRVECVPISDDDSVRATSAFSVRDSLKTDDEDLSQPITAVNAKLLRHEYNLMNHSNLVVCNFENNMAQLLVANKKHNEQTSTKMDKIVEEKSLTVHKPGEELKNNENNPERSNKIKDESLSPNKQDMKNHIDTASQSLENPKSSTKSGSDVSSGLSKSVPPSYKQKILQFSRDKLRFGSGGNKLTKSIKRFFHFSKSWDKNKTDNLRRTSEPTVEIRKLNDIEHEKGSKEEKDEDTEKSEIIVIVEEKSLSVRKPGEELKNNENNPERSNKIKDESLSPNKQDMKNHIDTASQSLENPKSSTKSGSDVSSGLSKSVPPSYKQKILQFSRDKLRFGSGGNKLTKSIKRSFHFSKSWDKNKTDNLRRTSEPTVEIRKLNDIEHEKGSKEEKDEDTEKSEIIEETFDDKEIADNDSVLHTGENKCEKEPSVIELEEWEAFLNSNISEVMNGDVESLTQLNMVRMVVGAVAAGGGAGAGGAGARVCGAVAALLALPPALPALPAHTLLNIQDVYLEAKVVHNFIFAINALVKKSKDDDEVTDERWRAAERMLEVVSWLAARGGRARARAARQLAAALGARAPAAALAALLATYEKTPRIVLNVVGLLIAVLQDQPEHADVVERILFSNKDFNFLRLLDPPSDVLRIRVCILISLLCTFSCTSFSVAMETKWTKKESDRLEALHNHCNVTLSRAAKLATKELSNMPFYIN